VVTGPPTAVNHSIINSVSIQSHLFVPFPCLWLSVQPISFNKLNLSFSIWFLRHSFSLILSVWLLTLSLLLLSVFLVAYPLLAHFLLAFAKKFQYESINNCQENVWLKKFCFNFPKMDKDIYRRFWSVIILCLLYVFMAGALILSVFSENVHWRTVRYVRTVPERPKGWPLLTVEIEVMGTQRVQMKGVPPWLVR